MDVNLSMNYFLDIVKIIIPILLSGFLGNFVVQRWQQRNWRQQQQLLRAEKDIEALKSVIDDLMLLADSRSYRSRRLLLQLPNTHPNEQDLERVATFKDDYSKSVVAWNEKFNSLCARITMYAPQEDAQYLEELVQPKFIEISSRLESMLKNERVGLSLYQEKMKVDHLLNQVNGLIGELTKSLIRYLKLKQDSFYLGRKVSLNEHNIEYFSTWKLAKALFKPDQSFLTVFGPASDSTPPVVRGL